MDIEDAIQVRGRALLEAVRPERLITLSPAWWQERLMGWATSDPAFRVKLLRFVDVLPSLRSSAAIAGHVRQYFREGAPAPVRLGSAVAGAGAFRPVLSRIVRQGVFTMADRFIGGSSPAEVLERLSGLMAEGTAYTVDLLGEAVLSEAEADTYLDRYLGLIRTLGAGGDHSRRDAVTQPNVSVKLSALTPHFEPAAPEAVAEAVSRRFIPLLRAARELGVFVNIDMEQYRYRDLTHFIFEQVLGSPEFAAWTDAGIVVQAYLRDAPEAIGRLREFAERRGTAVTVRLVKGAYWDEEVVLARQESRSSPVFEDKAATDANYERCTQLLVESYPHLRPAFGTHNPRTITQAMVRAEAAGLPREHVEFQMLYGMAEGLRRAVQESGYRTRVYVPIGEILPGMAYLVRRLLENTSNESWLVHRHEEGDPEDLLRAPLASAPLEREAPWFVNATPAEFYRGDVRSEMAAALEGARARFGTRYPLMIEGDGGAPGEWDEVRCPAEPKTLMGLVARASPADADRAVVAAAKAFPAWRDTPAGERAAILRRAAELLTEQRFEFAATMVFECAKPWAEADGDVIEAIDYLRYYAGCAERLGAGAEMVEVPGEDDRYLYEGRGVAVVIAPWNFPLAILCGMATAALAAGCAAILKPAEQSPIIAAKLAGLLREAGVPRGALQYVPGPGETVGEALVSHPGVDVIAFTGSNAVGLEIIKAAATVHPGQRNVKRVIAEMGGKNAIIVDDDADLDQAVSGVVTSAFGYAGQKCSACSRVIAVGSAYDEFRARLAAAVESLVVGPPEDPYTNVPPVISDEAREGIERYIEVGRTGGCVVGARLFSSAPAATWRRWFSKACRESRR